MFTLKPVHLLQNPKDEVHFLSALDCSGRQPAPLTLQFSYKNRHLMWGSSFTFSWVIVPIWESSCLSNLEIMLLLERTSSACELKSEGVECSEYFWFCLLSITSSRYMPVVMASQFSSQNCPSTYWTVNSGVLSFWWVWAGTTHEWEDWDLWIFGYEPGNSGFSSGFWFIWKKILILFSYCAKIFSFC